MAAPDLGSYVYCAQFGEAADYWLSSPGTFYTMGPPYACDKRWVVIEPVEFQKLLDGYSAPSNFYGDATSLFGLGLVAIVSVWAWKAIVLKLFYAS